MARPSTAQMLVVSTGLIALAVALMYVPYEATYTQRGDNSKARIGYFFAWSPPNPVGVCVKTFGMPVSKRDSVQDIVHRANRRCYLRPVYSQALVSAVVIVLVTLALFLIADVFPKHCHQIFGGKVKRTEPASTKFSPAVKKIAIWTAVIVFAALAGSIGRRAAQSGAEIAFGNDKGKATEGMLQQMAKELNSGLPMMVDKDTRLDRVSAGPGKKVIYHYTLVTIASSDVTPQQLRNAMETNVTSYVCTNEDMRGFRESDVVVSYSYRGSDGGVIGDISIYPRDCM